MWNKSETSEQRTTNTQFVAWNFMIESFISEFANRKPKQHFFFGSNSNQNHNDSTIRTWVNEHAKLLRHETWNCMSVLCWKYRSPLCVSEQPFSHWVYTQEQRGYCVCRSTLIVCLLNVDKKLVISTKDKTIIPLWLSSRIDCMSLKWWHTVGMLLQCWQLRMKLEMLTVAS